MVLVLIIGTMVINSKGNLPMEEKMDMAFLPLRMERRWVVYGRVANYRNYWTNIGKKWKRRRSDLWDLVQMFKHIYSYYFNKLLIPLNPKIKL